MSEKNLLCPSCGESFSAGSKCPNCNTGLLTRKEGTISYRERFPQEDIPDVIPLPDNNIPCMLIYRKKEFYKILELESAPVLTIGRSPEAEIWLAMETVSKQHARIYKKENKYYIRDLGSRNGTHINGHTLPPNGEKELCDGDMIRISAFYMFCHFPTKTGKDLAFHLGATIPAIPKESLSSTRSSLSNETLSPNIPKKESPSAPPQEDHTIDYKRPPLPGGESDEKILEIDESAGLPGNSSPSSKVSGLNKGDTALHSKIPEPNKRDTVLQNKPSFANKDETVRREALHFDVENEDAYMNTMFAIRADKKMKEKFDEAEKIVRHYLKPLPPQKGKAHFSCMYRPLNQIGGDFYSVFSLDDTRIGISLGDVSGHGMPAALIMIACITMLELHGRHTASPGEVLTKVNQDIAPRLESGKFVTVFYGVLDTESGSFSYSSAGHHPPILFNPQQGGIRSLPGKGPAFGFVKKVEFKEHNVILSPQDRVLLFTDGVIEAGGTPQEADKKDLIDRLKEILNSYSSSNFIDVIDGVKQQIAVWEGRDEFGLERLQKILESHSQSNPAEVLEVIYQEVEKFLHPNQVDDDITMIVIDWEK